MLAPSATHTVAILRPCRAMLAPQHSATAAAAATESQPAARATGDRRKTAILTGLDHDVALLGRHGGWILRRAGGADESWALSCKGLQAYEHQ